jgi:glycoprotein endo-alpha-1,2-mannosidase
MRRLFIVLISLMTVVAVTACAPAATATASATAPPRTKAGTPSSGSGVETPFLAVTGPDPSPRVAAFYYPWYGSDEVDGSWIHWDQAGYHPPSGIGSDFYPLLGPYSSIDRAVVAQHFGWLREAGVGVIVSSWWGRGSREDRAVPILLEVAEDYGIQVAFHLEPYDGRSSHSLLRDVEYLYDNYGDSPAFFRTQAPSRWSPDNKAKGLFYLWSACCPDGSSEPVEPDYWREALDAIHALPDGGLVLSDVNVAEWVDGGHFDGLYNYGVLDKDVKQGYLWAQSIPPGAWYVPGINPGFSAQRIRYPADLDTPRRDGETYHDRWSSALGVGVEPEIVTITTFNEWHEGTQIEPAAPDMTDASGHAYQDYDPMPPDGYLILTSQWVNSFQGMSWPENDLLSIRLSTTSDWTEFRLISGGRWIQPDILSFSEEAVSARIVDDHFSLTQPITRAEAGGVVEMNVDLVFIRTNPGGELVFEIERGNLGSTRVEFFRYEAGAQVPVESVVWSGITNDGRNAYRFPIPTDALVGGAR